MRKPDDIESLIPHAGQMCLLERILAWDEDSITLATTSHRSASNPLTTAQGLRAIHLCEYGAQAMAIHGGLIAEASGLKARPGLLVLLRDVILSCDYADDLPGELTVEARRISASEAAWQYSFRVLHGARPLAEGRATIAVGPAL
jgi:predicted hotdog family 3-hydroxylacyl-ACP dehydratase